MNKSMCLLPWNGVAIRAGGVAVPCCRFNISDKFTETSKVITDFRNSETWKTLRQNMLDGVLVKECSQCYRQEASGGKSTRVFSLEGRDSIPSTIDVEPIRMLDIAFSNLCNLACAHCSGWYSTKWGAEDFKNGRGNYKILLDSSPSIVDNLDLSQLLELKIFGGEPFMDQDKFIHLMEKLDLSKIKLLISTNGTILPNDRLRALMEKCRLVDLEVSIDGIDSVNEWYRWPSKFLTVTEVMSQFQNWWGNKPNFKLATHTAINIFNIWNFDEFIKFMNKNYANWRLEFDWVVTPAWQSLAVIPENNKQLLRTSLKKWAEGTKGNWVLDKGNPFLISIDRMNDTVNSSFLEFKEKTLALSKERNLDLLKMVPCIAPLFSDTVDITSE